MPNFPFSDFRTRIKWGENQAKIYETSFNWFSDLITYCFGWIILEKYLAIIATHYIYFFLFIIVSEKNG